MNAELNDNDVRLLESMWGKNIRSRLEGSEDDYAPYAMPDSLQVLLDNGLVERQPHFNAYAYRLTPLGVDVAQRLCAPPVLVNPVLKNVDCGLIGVWLDRVRRNNVEVNAWHDEEQYGRMLHSSYVANWNLGSILSIRKN